MIKMIKCGRSASETTSGELCFSSDGSLKYLYPIRIFFPFSFPQCRPLQTEGKDGHGCDFIQADRRDNVKSK